MLKAEISPGKEYAFWEKRGPGVPLQRVKTIYPQRRIMVQFPVGGTSQVIDA